MVRLRKPGLDMAVGENMLTSRYLEQNFIVFHIVSYGTAEDDLQLGFGYLQILLLQHTGPRIQVTGRVSLKVFQHLVSVHLLVQIVSLEAVVDEALDLAAVVYELLEVELVGLVARDLSQRQEPGHQLRHDQHHHHRASRDLWGKSECIKQLWLFKPNV